MAIGISSGAALEMRFYWGGEKYSIHLEREELRELVAMNPAKEDSITLSVAQVTKKSFEGLSAFLEGTQAKNADLRRVGLEKIFKFGDGQEVWLWEAFFEYAPENGGGAIYAISIYITDEGKLILPEKVSDWGRK